MAAVADHKEIRPERLEVRLERVSTPGSVWRTSFVVHIDAGTGLTPREQAILYNSARTCEVHKLLTGEVSFDYQWMQATNAAQEM